MNAFYVLTLFLMYATGIHYKHLLFT